MFETGDFDLDGNWFADDFQGNLNPASQNKYEQPTTSTRNNSEFDVQTKKVIGNMVSISPKRKVVLKRKFPGPAGLFPEGESAIKLGNDSHIENNNSFILSTQLLCSQNSTEMFERPTWLDMYKDFNDSASPLLNKYNIRWIKNNMPLNSTYKKVPFLAAIIKEVKNTLKSPTFVLADLTGEMEALISTDLCDEYDKYLSDNSVIILKQFNILSINPSKHYININTDNLVRIYTCKDEAEVTILHIEQTSNVRLKADVEEFINKCERSEHNVLPYNERERKEYNNGNSSKFVKNSFNVLSDKNGIVKDSRANMQSKFKFKNTSANMRENKATEDKIHTSTIARDAQNMFDGPDNSFDLDLSIDDFQDNFVIPNEVRKENEEDTNKYNRNQKLNYLLHTCSLAGEISPNKKQKLDAFKFKSKMKENPNTSALSIVNTKGEPNKTVNVTNKIDCSQISIISKNNDDNFDVKDVFSDLDAADLFGDF